MKKRSFLENNAQVIFGIFGILVPIGTLFLPFYESVLMLDKALIQGLMYTYEVPEVGEVAVIGAAGSWSAWVNIPVCVLLSALLLIRKQVLWVAITAGVVFLICNFLVLLGNSAGFGRPIADRMLSGYSILSLTEIILILLSIHYSIQRKKRSRETAVDF